MTVGAHESTLLDVDRRDARGGLERVGASLLVAAFAIWLIQPVGSIPIVALGYLLACAGGAALMWAHGSWLSPGVLVGALATTAASLVAAVVGLAGSAPGVWSEAVFFVGLPLVWIALTSAVDLRDLRVVLNAVPVLAAVIGALGVAYFLHTRGVPYLAWSTWLPLGQGAGSDTFGSQLRFYPISTLIFVVPYLFWSLVDGRQPLSRFARTMTPVSLALTVAFTLVAGRRAIFLSTAVAVAVGLLVLFLRRYRDRGLTRRLGWFTAAAASGSVVVARATGFDLVALVESALGERSSAEDVRSASMTALLDSWARSPWFGHGLGSEALSSVRSVERPWQFEAQYHAALHAFGIVGFLVLAIATLYIVERLVGLAVRGDVHEALPVVAGVIGALVANYTNPYLHTPGHYWMFFVAVMLVNSIDREGRPARTLAYFESPLRRINRKSQTRTPAAVDPT